MEYSRSSLAYRSTQTGHWFFVRNGNGLHKDLLKLSRDRVATGEAFPRETVVRMPRRRRYRDNPMHFGWT